jgi:heme oxygenase
MMDLAERLRTDTRALHVEAERAGAMRSLLRGELGMAGYCALLRNLHAIYAALEPALDRQATHPVLATMPLQPLYRQAALAADLHRLQGAGWRDLAVLPATATYVQRLRTVEASDPVLLLAHAYVRYLGDLSGGQLLRGIVLRMLGPAGEGATGFYDFGDAAAVAAHAASFRQRLRALPLTGDAASHLVAEARRAFGLHVELFEALVAEPGSRPGG